MRKIFVQTDRGLIRLDNIESIMMSTNEEWTSGDKTHPATYELVITGNLGNDYYSMYFQFENTVDRGHFYNQVLDAWLDNVTYNTLGVGVNAIHHV